MNKIMHVCPKCNKEFHGKRTRIYCSRECAYASMGDPWNKGKTGLPANHPKTGEIKTCQRCGNEFYKQKSSRKSNYCSMACYLEDRWVKTGKCAECGKETKTRFCSDECRISYWNKRDSEHREKRKQTTWDRKKELIERLGGKCVQCGNADIRVLDINHIDQSQKLTPKNRQYSWAGRFRDWEANQDNIEILCANCHRIHTWEQMGYGKVNGKSI